MATAQELLEEEERIARLRGSIGNRLPTGLYFDISRALAGLDAAGENEVNTLRTVMGGSANFRMPSGGLTAASVKSMMGMQDDDILQQIVNLQSQSNIKDEAEYRKWYTDQGFDSFFFEPAREKWRTSQKALRSQAEELHKSTVTRPKELLAFKTAEGVRDYDLKRANRQAILQEVVANYKAPRPGVPRISTVQAITLLQNRLVAEGTKQEDIDRAVDHLKEVISLQQGIEEGEINTTVGAVASNVFSKLIGGGYGPDEVQWVDALADYEAQMSQYPGVSTEQYDAGRKKIDDLITKMKDEKAAKIAEAAEQHRIAVARPSAVLALEKAEADARKVAGTDVKNISASRVSIYEQYKDSQSMGDWYLARQALQDSFDKARAGGAVFEAGQVDQQYEELERSLSHLKPIEWTGDIKELMQLTALASPIGKTPEQAAIARGQAIEAIKMAIRKDPITSQMTYFKNNLNTYAEGIVDSLIALQTGESITTTFYDSDGNPIILDSITEWPRELGRTQNTPLVTNREPTAEEAKALREAGIRFVKTPSRNIDLQKSR